MHGALFTAIVSHVLRTAAPDAPVIHFVLPVAVAAPRMEWNPFEGSSTVLVNNGCYVASMVALGMTSGATTDVAVAAPFTVNGLSAVIRSF